MSENDAQKGTLCAVCLDGRWKAQIALLYDSDMAPKLHIFEQRKDEGGSAAV